jgi:hypothetical protein
MLSLIMVDQDTVGDGLVPYSFDAAEPFVFVF